MTKQNIVVVGAGYAGVSATKFLAKKFKKDADVLNQKQFNTTYNVCSHARKT